jgi:tetratricopeptide (TPR) repeat protein
MKAVSTTILILFSAAVLTAQPPPGGGRGPQTEYGRQSAQLQREGKMDAALDVLKKELQAHPDSVDANNRAGLLLDLMGKGQEARQYFQKAIDAAPDAAAKANMQRAMAMSYAFSGDCKNTAKYEDMVFAYYVTVGDFYNQGEMADEAARVCIDYGDLDTAYTYYKKGYEAGLKEPNISDDRKLLWEFRWEHAQARIAIRRGQKAEAAKHVAAAKAAVDGIKQEGLKNQQQAFYPYLTGYVALYAGDYNKALADLQNASQNDPFIQCLIGMTHEKMGNQEKAMEYYKKAATASAHNPPAAFARPYATKKIG